MTQPNVLRVNSVEETASYRDAVAEILRNVQSDHKLTLAEIADRLDISLGTVSNAANKKADLSPTYLNRVGKAFGASALDPNARLSGGRMVPITPTGSGDVLPFVAMASYRIAQARSPSSPGGTSETLREQLDMLPELSALQRELEAAICQIEKRRDAA